MDIYLVASRLGKIALVTSTSVNNCFSIYKNSEIIEQKNDIFNSFTVVNDLVTILARNDRTAVVFSC